MGFSTHSAGRAGRAVLGAAIIAVAAVSLAVACSGGSSTAPTAANAGSLETLPKAATSSLAPSAPRPVCSAETLTPVATAKFAGATLDDIACSGAFAAATVVGVGQFDGDGVVLFAADNGQWTIVASDRVSADPNALVPKTFPIGTYTIWKQKYDDRKNPYVAPKASPKGPTTTDPTHHCDGQPDTPCSPVTETTLAPTTTTTKPPTTTTTAPPPPEPPASEAP